MILEILTYMASQLSQNGLSLCGDESEFETIINLLK